MPGSLVGHVDRIDEHSITGWLADLDQPERLETVRCVDRAGREVVFTTCHAREDVGRFFGVPLGRSGFVIPLTVLGGMAAPVTVRDRSGAVLPGGEAVAVPPGEQRAQGEPATVFLHIPKTAGTSVRHALLDGLLPSEWLLVYPPPFGMTVEEVAALPAVQRRAARLVAGHLAFGIEEQLGRAARYVTFLREPMARLRSHVAHHDRAGTSFAADGIGPDLVAVADGGLDEQFDNLMVRLISGVTREATPLGRVGEAEMERALSNIERHFAFVGAVETIEADMAVLLAMLGREGAPVRRENVNADRDWMTTAGGAFDWGRIEERNRFDRMLWERVRG